MKKKFLALSLGIMIAMLGTACSTDTGTGSGAGEPSDRNESSDGSEAITLETVELDAGNLVGYQENGIYNFKGIPYATAERFQDPVPVESYEGGTRMALAYGPVSPQSRTLSSTADPNVVEILTPSNGTADMVGNENCQYLNVWTDSLEGEKPVVVFFHGGGLSSGASSELSTYTGEYFAETEDAVFVSVNHRLNVLGYLDLSAYGDEYANSGMAGMRDCVCALQWVQDNIAQFGGDPDNVTIVGQSGGGHKVATLACMSDTADLFDKVVCLSGYYSYTPKENGLANTHLLVDYLGLSEDEVIPTLTEMSYEELYNASTEAGCVWDYLHYGDSTLEAPLFDENGQINQYAAQRQWISGFLCDIRLWQQSPNVLMKLFREKILKTSHI